jgi:hypothetical protein
MKQLSEREPISKTLRGQTMTEKQAMSQEGDAERLCNVRKMHHGRYPYDCDACFLVQQLDATATPPWRPKTRRSRCGAKLNAIYQMRICGFDR